MASLNLSDLKTGVAYPLENSQSAGKCLIHMKLTDFCVKSIDALVNSNRGAVFSLKFKDNGGTMVIPVDNGEARKFQFKTAGIQSRAEGQNILECVRQEINDVRVHKLSCTGPIEHRLTVQGTDQIYESTKTRVKQVEQKRKEAMTQEIKLPTKGSRSKKKSSLIAPISTERTTPSPTFRKPAAKPAPLKSTSSSVKPAPGGVRSSSHTKPSAPVKVSHSLRERVIHFLALKPQRREEVLSRMKKETKKSEASMAAMVDTILSEVSEVSSSNHRLKAQFINDLQVEDWPHYSEAERQLMRRRYSKPAVTNSNTVPPPSTGTSTFKRVATDPQPTGASTTKRVLSDPQSIGASATKRVLSDPMTDIDTSSKRPKLDHPLSSAHKPQLIIKDAPRAVDPVPTPPLHPPPVLPITKEDGELKKKRKKKKEKHKVKTNSDPVVNSDPSSTTADSPDLRSEFPAIQTDHQRTLYKQAFYTDYTEYLQLKDSIDVYQKDCTDLSERLSSLPKRSEEATAIGKLIRTKYNNKRRFQELHDKLDHIKKQVVEYDTRRVNRGIPS